MTSPNIEAIHKLHCVIDTTTLGWLYLLGGGYWFGYSCYRVYDSYRQYRKVKLLMTTAEQVKEIYEDTIRELSEIHGDKNTAEEFLNTGPLNSVWEYRQFNDYWLYVSRMNVRDCDCGEDVCKILQRCLDRLREIPETERNALGE